MQKRPDLIPPEVIARRIDELSKTNNYSQRARFYIDLGMEVNATKDYLHAVLQFLEDGKLFSAAFYLKELVNENVISVLFEKAFEKAVRDDDLWWQIRSLQELGWNSELNELLLRNAKRIEESGNTDMVLLLAIAKNDEEKVHKLRKELLLTDIEESEVSS